MGLILDTHALIWLEEGDSRVTPELRKRIDNEPELFISKASVWEMAIKVSSGKLQLRSSLDKFISEFLDDFECKLMDINLEEILFIQQLPFHHRDPFDRLLIAQAVCHNHSIVSVDVVFDEYEVNRIW